MDLRASIIFVSGEPVGAEYTDEAGTIYGDTAVLRLPIQALYTISPLPVAEAEALAGRARIFHTQRIYTHAKVGADHEISPSGGAGVGTLTVRVKEGSSAPLRIELWKSGRIVASDTTDNSGTVSFRLLQGTYECCVRNGISLVSKTSITFPGGDLEMVIPVGGVNNE